MTREEAINTVRNIYQTDKEKEALEILIPELAESEDERIRKKIIGCLRLKKEEGKEFFGSEPIDNCIAYLEKQKEHKPLPPFDEMSPEEKMNHPLYLEGFDMGREVQKVFDEQKPNIEICPHSVKSKSYKENGFPFEGLKGPKGPSCDPGRRGRMGLVPKEISKEAEAFQAQFPGPYDKDDIITAYETAKMKAIEDLPKWKESKVIGVGECTIGAAFEATGRRYPILYCYGYGISIEQLFEKLPKKKD